MIESGKFNLFKVKDDKPKLPLLGGQKVGNVIIWFMFLTPDTMRNS